MQVYVEFAVLENFCMDYTLLYSAKLAVKNGAGWGRVAVAAAIGAAFAVLFPLFGLNAIWSVVVKIASGAAICAVAGKFKSVKGFLKFTAAFLIFSAFLAGALIGIFTLTGTEYSEGAGYILSSVPVGIPLFGALLLVLGAKRIAKKFSKGNKTEFDCRITLGENSVSLKGFFDSGNRVFYRGVPVTVIPQSAAEKLIDISRINESVNIHTVAGSKKIAVFTADRLEVENCGKTQVYKGVKMGVSPAKINCAVLHPDISED